MAARPESLRVLIRSVAESSKEEAAGELARLLSMPRDSAKQIVSNPPIILIDGLTQEQAANVETHLLRLRRLGVDVEITSEATGKIPKCNWPTLPAVALVPAGIMICPHCGERIVIQPAPTRKPSATAAGPPARAEKATARVEKTTPVRIPEQEEPLPFDEEELPVEPSEGLVSTPTAVIESSAQTDDLDTLIEEAQALVESQKGKKPEPVAPAQNEAAEQEELSPFEAVESAEEEPSEAAAPPPPPGGTGGGYDVSVIKVKKKARPQVAELMRQLQDMETEDAMDALGKTVAIVVRDGTKEQAQYAVEHLKKLGVKLRVKKR